MDNILKNQCKDKTAITIGTVSIHRNTRTKQFWPASFKIARACDIRSSENCLVDLQDVNPKLYREQEMKIDISSYALLVDIGT